ncbi:AMP-binding protein [Micromonospora sp. NPDC051925]|uniref:AMP-binding protein n=1 Tax=Micromonospora sp. NPDC051925 TaxID=3364288 RepID=UPI0037C76648
MLPELHDLGAAIAAQARQRPTAVALVHDDTDVTYGELLERAEKARLHLAGLHLAPGEPVSVPAQKTPGTVATVLACLLTGRPFLLPSTALPDEVVGQLNAVAGCRAVEQVDAAARPGADAPAAQPPPGTSFMLTTSGSTGLPKVVPLTGTAVARFASWAASTFDIGVDTTVLNYAPLNFDLCLLDIWTTLAYGGRVVLVDPERAANGRYLANLLRRHPPQVVQAVPFFYGLLDEAVDAHFDSVRHVMVTGDAVSERVLAALPGLFPAARRWNIYGCTETNDSFVHEFGDDAAVPVPIGHPLPGVDALVVGLDDTVLDGPGVGELWVHTPFQTTGYLTPGHADRFGERPGGADGRRWFRTGDLVSRDPDGTLTVVGRSDFQVKIRGFAVNTAEIERVLLEHPEVVEAAAVALPDPVTGHRLAAAVRRAPGSRLNSLTLRKHCARRLPQAAIPSTLRIGEQPLPRTSTGKVDRSAVGRLFEQAEGRTP